MKQTIELASAGAVVLDLIETINENRAYLSEIDGAIGDGDHGINMSKGFSQCRDALRGEPTLPGLAPAFGALSLRRCGSRGARTNSASLCGAGTE